MLNHISSAAPMQQIASSMRQCDKQRQGIVPIMQMRARRQRSENCIVFGQFIVHHDQSLAHSWSPLPPARVVCSIAWEKDRWYRGCSGTGLQRSLAHEVGRVRVGRAVGGSDDACDGDEGVGRRRIHVMHDAIMRMQPGVDITGAIYAHNLRTRDRSREEVVKIGEEGRKG